VFVAFIERLARDLTGGDAHLGPQRVDDLLPLRSAREQAVGVSVTDPDGKQALSFAESATAQSYPLNRAGFYEVRLANGRTDLVAVNTDRRESDLAPIPAETLSLWTGGKSVGNTPRNTDKGAAGAQGDATPERAAPRAGATVQGSVQLPLWWYAMLGLLAVALAESVLAGGYLGTKREDP